MTDSIKIDEKRRSQLREGLFQQAHLYTGITREAWEVGREGARLTPRDWISEAIEQQNAYERGERFVASPTYREGCLASRQAS